MQNSRSATVRLPAMEHLRWRPTVNERDFIECALQSDLRVDGRHSFDFRKLKITFGRYISLLPIWLFRARFCTSRSRSTIVLC